MATTSSLLTFSAHHPLLGCGVDIEKVSRFNHVCSSDLHPFPFVFSQAEVNHCRTLSNPAFGLCALFCAKEALFKALGSSYNFPECEGTLDAAACKLSLNVSFELRREHGIQETISFIKSNLLDENELIVTVLLFG